VIGIETFWDKSGGFIEALDLNKKRVMFKEN
jgi:hypothetical protein